jgi:ABC-type dipeptide/oligopeptide/nickel transport system permease subunit
MNADTNIPPKGIDLEIARPPSTSQRLGEQLAILFSSRIAVVGLVVIAFWVFVAIFAPFITRYDPLEQDFTALDAAPGGAISWAIDHWRDVVAHAFGRR